MKKIILPLLLLCTAKSFCQSKPNGFNFDFEKQTPGENLPDDWFTWGKDYKISIDKTVAQHGKSSVSLVPEGKEAEFGCVVLAIPANYAGETIELKAFLKTEDVKNGFAGLIMRIDGKDNILEMDNMNDRGTTGTTDWKQYSVKLPLSSKAKKIFVGAIHTGTGKVWADNFEVFINDKNINDLKPTEKQASKASKDTEFDKGSAITAITLNKKGTKDIEVLGQVWGFLKYYHPAVSTGNYNWDYELFRIMPKILETKSEQQRDEILLTWIASLGEFKIKQEKPLPANQVRMQANLGWIEKIDNSQLKTQLYKIKDAERSGVNEYVEFAPGVGNTLYNNENGYAEMKYPDAGFRMLSLYRYWNIINYFFPYRDIIGEDWNTILTEFIPKFNNAKNEEEYQLTCLEIIARIHDTHANAWGDYNGINKFWGVNYAPVKVTFTEGQPVVTSFLHDELGPKTGLQKGDVITAINNKPVADIIKKSLKHIPASNYETQLRDIALQMMRSNESTMNVTYQRGKKTLKATINTYPEDKIDIYKIYKEQAKDTCFKMLSPKIAYLFPGSIKSSYLKKIMETAKDTDGLIIDLRCYPSDFIVFSLSEYLNPKATSFAKFSATNLQSPGTFTYTPPISVGKENKDNYNGKIVILVNETTQSQAEYSAMAFRRAPKVTVIGSTTAGADGNVSRIILPGNIKTAMSGIGVYYPDGKETQRIGIVPDITIKPTIAGIRQNRDEVLEKAIEIINKK